MTRSTWLGHGATVLAACALVILVAGSHRSSEAAAGAKIDLPTPHGTIALKIPPGTSSGKRLRVKGHGVRPKSGEPGDLFAVVEIVLPHDLTPEEQAWLAELATKHPQQVRGDLSW